MSSTYVRPDIVVTKPSGAPVALIQLWNPITLSRKDAIDYRDRTYHHGWDDWRVSFFLLLSQDVGFVWDEGAQAKGASPTLEFSMAPVIKRYLPHHDGRERLLGFSLDMLVNSWLNELAGAFRDVCDEPETSLAATGFIEKIQGGYIRIDDEE